MLLALDIGNSQTSFGIFIQGTLKHHWRAETKLSRTPDEYASLLFPLLQYAGLSQVQWDGIAVCSVVPSAEHAFETFCVDYLKHKPFRVHSGLTLGCRINVDMPTEVGADRLANAAYAVKHLPLPAIVIDMGTATTFDVISANRDYEGGMILPGIRMGADALGNKTSKLPMVDLRFPKSAIGKNTVECIRAGVLFGYCDMLDGLLARVQKELGAPSSVALTGGLAAFLHPHLKVASQLLPNLTLEGVELLYQSNRTQ